MIAPALLGADPLALADAIADVERAEADLLHVDVMDGHFVRDINFGLRTVRAIRERTTLPVDVHLQVQQPERLLDELVDIAPDTVSVHVESTQHLSAVLRGLEGGGIRKGVVLNPATPLGVLDEVLEQVDQVVLMTSNPGTSDFLPHVLDKIGRLRALLVKRGIEHVRLVADGGVTAERAGRLVDAGADVLVAASAVFAPRHGGPPAAVGTLRAAR